MRHLHASAKCAPSAAAGGLLVSNNMAPFLYMHLSACSFASATKTKRPPIMVLRPTYRDCALERLQGSRLS